MEGGLRVVELSVDDDIVVYVNSDDITAAEFELVYTTRVRGPLLTHYVTTSSNVNDPLFWETTNAEGVTPADVAKQKTLRVAIRVKVERRLAVESHLLPDASFRGVMTRWASDKLKRSEACARGGVVYGPVSHDLGWFYSYEQSLVNTALRRLAGASARQSDLIAHYRNASERFANLDIVGVNRVGAESDDGGRLPERAGSLDPGGSSANPEPSSVSAVDVSPGKALIDAVRYDFARELHNRVLSSRIGSSMVDVSVDTLNRMKIE